MDQVFFVVWNPQGRTPMVRHEREAIAIREAERLAAQNPGQRFYVLQSNTVSEHKNVTTTRLEHELPF